MLALYRPPVLVNFAVAYILVAAVGTASASDVVVVTDQQHPVQTGPDVRVIEIDAAARILASELATHLPSDPVQAATVARERLEAGGMELQRRLRLAYQGIVDAWSLGVTKIPAVIVDRGYVVYGDPDVNHAMALVEQYRSTQP